MTKSLQSALAALAVALAALALALAASPALADDVSFKGLKYSDAKIDKIEGDEIYFTTNNGGQSHRPISDQLHIVITGDANLNAAEDAFAALKFADAADAYQKVMKSSPKVWLRDYAATRLQKSAEKAGRYDAAVIGWLYLVQKDPAALKNKPALPADPNSAFIKTAETELESVASAVRNDESRQAILSYELELARYQKDETTIQNVANALIKMGAVNPATLLGLIHADIDARHYPQAQQKLAQLKGPLADPAQENDRLFCLAEVANFTAPANSAPSVYEDLALEYMHVVANDSGGPLAAQALLRVAALHEKFGDAPTALAIYMQIQKDYASAPEQGGVVAEAQKSITRLKAAQ